MDSGHPATIGDGRYAVDRRVGVGGCGAVYLAYDTVLNRWVAIKQIETADDISDPFLEARQLASLQHPNIVTIYDFFRSEGQTFVVMEYIPGQNINELTDPMALDFFTAFARQCLEALAAAHAIGLVHRDIKPANIMLAPTPSGSFQAKLLDFGLAKVMSEPSQQTMDHSGAITGSIHTPTMSPYLPVTGAEIAAQAIEAAEAGASILHLHARDPENGRPSPSSSERRCSRTSGLSPGGASVMAGAGLLGSSSTRMAVAAARRKKRVVFTPFSIAVPH